MNKEQKNEPILVKTTEFNDHYRIEHYPIDFEIPQEWMASDGGLLNSISLNETEIENATPEGEYHFCGCERNFCECENE